MQFASYPSVPGDSILLLPRCHLVPWMSLSGLADTLADLQDGTARAFKSLTGMFFCRTQNQFMALLPVRLRFQRKTEELLD